MEDTSPEAAIGKKGKKQNIFSYVGFCFLSVTNISKLFTQNVLSCVPSSSKVPASLCHPTARQASVFTEAALYREGSPHQCPPLCTSIQTDLQIFGTLTMEASLFIIYESLYKGINKAFKVDDQSLTCHLIILLIK